MSEVGGSRWEQRTNPRAIYIPPTNRQQQSPFKHLLSGVSPAHKIGSQQAHCAPYLTLWKKQLELKVGRIRVYVLEPCSVIPPGKWNLILHNNPSRKRNIPNSIQNPSNITVKKNAIIRAKYISCKLSIQNYIPWFQH